MAELLSQKSGEHRRQYPLHTNVRYSRPAIFCYPFADTLVDWHLPQANLKPQTLHKIPRDWRFTAVCQCIFASVYALRLFSVGCKDVLKESRYAGSISAM